MRPLEVADRQPGFNLATMMDKKQSSNNLSLLAAFDTTKSKAPGGLEINVKPSYLSQKQRALRKRSPVSEAKQKKDDDEETRSFWAVRM